MRILALIFDVAGRDGAAEILQLPVAAEGLS
jgi:hypothetical protein